MAHSKKLLLVEDSKLVLKVLKRILHQTSEFEADFAEDLASARKLVESQPNQYFAALVDLNLPDAPNGEIVDLVLGNNLPTVVLTSTFSEKKKNDLFNKGIVDYVIKETRYSYESAIKIISRLNKNHKTKILVVDDSSVARKQCSRLLQKHLFQVFEAEGAKQAIQIMTQHHDIKLVITDYNMPGTDGFELVKLIRTKYDKQNLTIIGLSGDGDNSLSARFIKNGANDFLKKPFAQEEFYCRIMHCVENLESIELIRDSANKDYLTRLFNRQYFYQLCGKALERNQEENACFSIGVLEIDNFDEYNNVYHNYGDTIALAFSRALAMDFSDYLVGRLSTKQYVLYLNQIDENRAFELFDAFREKVKLIPIQIEDDEETINLSISGGIVTNTIFDQHESWLLKTLLVHCDQLLGRARDAGKDIIVYE